MPGHLQLVLYTVMTANYSKNAVTSDRANLICSIIFGYNIETPGCWKLSGIEYLAVVMAYTQGSVAMQLVDRFDVQATAW
jgi:hypothetical protein